MYQQELLSLICSLTQKSKAVLTSTPPSPFPCWLEGTWVVKKWIQSDNTSYLIYALVPSLVIIKNSLVAKLWVVISSSWAASYCGEANLAFKKKLELSDKRRIFSAYLSVGILSKSSLSRESSSSFHQNLVGGASSPSSKTNRFSCEIT